MNKGCCIVGALEYGGDADVAIDGSLKSGGDSDVAIDGSLKSGGDADVAVDGSLKSGRLDVISVYILLEDYRYVYSDSI